MRFTHRFVTRVSFLLVAGFLLAGGGLASAQGLGVRGGVTINPDQIHFGGHYESPALIEHLHFKPNIEIGVGDDTTLVAANFEFVYKFGAYGDWGFYAGGGPSVNFYSFDEADGETEGGVSALIGAETRRGLFFEVKLGLTDETPDAKFSVGWAWR
jgi:hypothetical protein